MTSFQLHTRILPARPSLESLRKQAKQLAREVAAQSADAIARARVHLPTWEPPLSHRDAQFVLAREYGFAGWRALREEVLKRTGAGLEWAASEAERAIHDNDVDRLRQLLADHPGLLAWRDEEIGSLLSMATSSFGDSGHPDRERAFTRADCAELLIDAGAVADPHLWRDVVSARANAMLQLFQRKGLLPRTLLASAALGDLEAVRASVDEAGETKEALNEAFLAACRFKHNDVSSILLDQLIACEPDLARRIDAGPGRSAFIDYLGESPPTHGGPWRTYVVNEVVRAIVDNDLPVFEGWIRDEPGLLGASCTDLQVRFIEVSTFNNRAPFIRRLLEMKPALLRSDPPPASGAIGFALEYGHAHLLGLLTPLWPLPDDLPHAAGVGDFDRVRRWFDEAGRPVLGDLNRHHPTNDPAGRLNLHWGAGNTQQVLDVALAWACMNKQFEIAAFLLARGANVNTDWSTHEPASILHECAVHGNFETAQFLIDRGADPTIKDYRWNATPAGWAKYAANDEAMAEFLMQAEEQWKLMTGRRST